MTQDFELRDIVIPKKTFGYYITEKRFSMFDFAIFMFIVTVIAAIPGVLIAIFT